MRMTHANLSVTMEAYVPNYTKTEKKLYAYIKNHLDTVMYNSLTELAEICAVGEATVLRFCRKIGYTGYQDFKLAAAQELTLMSVQHVTEETYMDRIRNNMQKIIDDTSASVDTEALEEAVGLMNTYDEIVVFGVGHSGITALDMQSRFMRVGKNVEVVVDAHFQAMRACSCGTKTLLVAISLSGSTKDIVDAVKIGRDRGARVIAITSYVRSPLTKYADVVLLTSGKESPLDGGSMVGKVSQLFVVDLLCTGYIMQNIQNAQAVKKEAAEVVASKLY